MNQECTPSAVTVDTSTHARNREDARPAGTSKGAALRSGTELILATKPFAVEKRLRSWWCVLSTAVLLAATLAAALLLENAFIRLGSSLLSGLLALRLFVIYHDQQHHAILANSKIADAFMWVFGLWSLGPTSIWRSSHNHHHNHNSRLRGSQIGSFPVMTADAFRRSPRVKRIKYLFQRHPLTLLFGYIFVFLIGMCLAPFIRSPRKHWDCLLALLLHVAVGISLVWAIDWKALVLVQTIPCLVLYAIGSYLFYIQHNFPGVVFKEHSGWTYEAAALESSSYLKLNPILAWFSANIGYHHIHHLNSRIPFYRLPEAMRAIPELQSPKVTTLHPMEVLRCLRLKVWDTAKQRMTGC